MRIIKHGGFTLIELIVVIAIIILMSGMSLAAYFRFGQRQAAMNDARNFATEMRKVQAMAKNLVYPAGCASRLERYRLKADCVGEGCTTMTTSAICSGVEILVKANEEVLTKVFFTDTVDVYFGAGTGAISQVGEFPIQNSNDPYTVVVKTDANGNISIKEYETYP